MDDQIHPLVEALTIVDERLDAHDRVVVEAFPDEVIAVFDRVSGVDARIGSVDSE